MGGQSTLRHMGIEGRHVWADQTDEQLWLKLLKRLMLLVERCQNKQCIRVVMYGIATVIPKQTPVLH